VGGMFNVIEGMMKLAAELGVSFKFEHAVEKLEITKRRADGLWANQKFHAADYVVASADYHHVEQTLLAPQFRTYSSTYWNTKVMAPSSLIFYVGLKKKLKKLLHHNLFFDQDFSQHAQEIYDKQQWPSAPLFYVCCPSVTDSSVAPDGYENLFILIPVAPGLKDEAQTRDKYFLDIINRLENITGESIRDHVVFKRSYAHNDFMADYNAFKGNAYGLANTLFQTANLKPRITNKSVVNLFYAGQLTVPGPGVPPSLISGQVVARELVKRSINTKMNTADERNF
jgi:phytoene desaturase